MVASHSAIAGTGSSSHARERSGRLSSKAASAASDPGQQRTGQRGDEGRLAQPQGEVGPGAVKRRQRRRARARRTAARRRRAATASAGGRTGFTSAHSGRSVPASRPPVRSAIQHLPQRFQRAVARDLERRDRGPLSNAASFSDSPRSLSSTIACRWPAGRLAIAPRRARRRRAADRGSRRRRQWFHAPARAGSRPRPPRRRSRSTIRRRAIASSHGPNGRPGS